MNQQGFTEIKKIIEAHREEIREKYSIRAIGVFGSFVRGEQEESSDIDILVEFEDDVGFFKFLEAEEYLSNILGSKVDLVTKGALKPYIGLHILEEVIMI
ncbi:MAG: nucleotidyltransferase family protein [Candidatus Sumerlaeota bacterium]|jgi:hypothetical protein|nr:nucleotidyltransferase family protein [Candidatus Sumerlaeota bacterium]